MMFVVRIKHNMDIYRFLCKFFLKKIKLTNRVLLLNDSKKI